MRDYLLLYVNGVRHEIRGSDAFAMLADFLREKILLTGTKIVCAEGDCGACTVLKSTASGFLPINSCIANLLQLDCSHILTVESLSQEGELHEVQRAMRDCNGSQCGFCTPGFVMAMAGYYEKNPGKTLTSISKAKNQLTGNLCRCTGYQPILEAAMSVDVKKIRSLTKRYHSKSIQADLIKAKKIPLCIDSTDGKLLAPTKLNALLALYKKEKQKHKSLKLLAGGTDLGVVVNKGKLFPAGEKKYWMSLHLLEEQKKISVHGRSIEIGAMASLSAVEEALEKKIPEFSRLLRIFASPQIKNSASLVGNIANGSPIGDTLPALIVLDAQLKIQSVGKTRWVPIAEFYQAYKVFDLSQTEVISAVKITVPSKNTFFKSYKVSQRKDLDISYISAAYLLEHKEGIIQNARVAYGGIAATVLRLPSVEKKLIGVSLKDTAALHSIVQWIPAQMQPRADLRGSAEGRIILAANLFKKFCHECLT